MKARRIKPVDSHGKVRVKSPVQGSDSTCIFPFAPRRRRLIRCRTAADGATYGANASVLACSRSSRESIGNGGPPRASLAHRGGPPPCLWTPRDDRRKGPGRFQCQAACEAFSPRFESSCEARWRVCAWPFQTHIRSPIGSAAPTSRLRAVRTQEDATILPGGIGSHVHSRFVHLGWRGIFNSSATPFALSWMAASKGLQQRPLDENTGGHVLPECDQQLSGQGDDCRLTPTTDLDPLAEPLA